MDISLSRVLAELRSDVPSATKEAGIENMRAVILRRGCDPEDVGDFLNDAADIWLARARTAGIVPATFYAWYDEMAGQLRISLVPGAADALPFAGSIELLASPQAVITAALSTWTPGLIPSIEFTEAEREEPSASERRLLVWSRTG
jgi:hypothetical protein